ncbi:MAG: hypothetical protein CMO47_02810 [Verrucomicrobiales bacterium]|nr:hypothetical protein [Verrucomicrobiales bacterium]
MGIGIVGLTGFLFGQEIPEELLEDDHVREEFGVNQFTTPSIRKIFEDLQTLRPLPYDELKRQWPKEVPQDRAELALSVGFLLADGFFAVESEQVYDLEPVGRTLLTHAKGLGSGSRISSHMNSLLQKAAGSDWEELKIELARTQKDVEKEMVMIRDVDSANLISLAGWLRAFEIGCTASLNPYSPEKASILARPEVVEYFIGNLKTMESRIQVSDTVKDIRGSLKGIQERVDLPEQEVLSENEVEDLRLMVEALLDDIYGSKRQIVSTQGGATKPAGEVPTTVRPDATGGVISGEVPE